MNKICPMPEMLYCGEEKCGWWNDDLNKCSLVSIAGSLDIIAATLDNTDPPATYTKIPE